jgi:hypothetical protein
MATRAFLCDSVARYKLVEFHAPQAERFRRIVPENLCARAERDFIIAAGRADGFVSPEHR